VTIVNRSDNVLPAADTDRTFNAAVLLGTSVREQPDKELSPRTPLPRNDLAPGESVKMTLEVHCPARPGRYDVRFDLVEERVTWFARQGSPMGRMELIVTPEDQTASDDTED
jgi:hypothetical protein